MRGLLVPVLGTTALIACAYFLGALITITRKLKVILAANLVAGVLAAALSMPLIRAYGMAWRQLRHLRGHGCQRAHPLCGSHQNPAAAF